MHNASEHALAVLVDIENMARPGARNRGEFDIHLVMNRLAEKGRVVVKRAYADWSRYRDARRELMNAGLELIEMPSAREGAKNRADIKMAVDAMEIAYSRQHVDNFVIVSGDSDFTPLVGKLRELNKRVIGVGRDASSASPLLIANCDEFFFYDSLASKALPHHAASSGVRPDALSLLRETLMARGREGDEHPQASAVKDSMRRRDPAFDEGEIGFSTFSKFLEDAQAKGVVRLERDPRSGTFAVELTDTGAPAATTSDWPAAAGDDRPPVEIADRTRRRRRRRGEPSDPTAASGEATPVTPLTNDGDAEVFEFEVRARPPVAAPLPPLDQPITYEDVVLAGDEIDADIPDLIEATDAVEEPPTRGSRRRRRSLATVAEPTTDDLAADDETEAVAETPAAVDANASDADATPAAGRRRVRRGTVLGAVLPAEETPPATPATAHEDEAPAPRRRTRAKKAVDEGTETPAEATVAEEAPAAPKRRTRAKPPEEPVSAPLGAAPAAQAEAPKPKRKPRAKAAPEADAPEAADAPLPDDEAPAPKRRVRRKPTADESEGDTATVDSKESPY